jgi:hypothetical protein
VAYPIYVDPNINEEEGAPGWSFIERHIDPKTFVLVEEPIPFAPAAPDEVVVGRLGWMSSATAPWGSLAAWARSSAA